MMQMADPLDNPKRVNALFRRLTLVAKSLEENQNLLPAKRIEQSKKKPKPQNKKTSASKPKVKTKK